MKNILICFLLLFSTNIALATGAKDCSNCIFTGTVVDAVTKKPVTDVMVIARGIESGDEQKFTTDQNGQYKIPTLPAGTYIIRFEKHSYKACEKKNLSVKKNTTGIKINIELMYDEEEQEEDHHNWLPKYNIL
ncbi:carboxypeptidase regulatory-like domain-containing protein [Panacibacter sp. DH6]|uniref:Carboxypeptidase regulatory-like domain-containing protein n=1 Tax=Panacibacter microcysteis TaxID=2793269 RepID=A0A931EAM1_9BACT|nr:carboxypeptidase-like regulatory domain-containing protein [Panacibacter microcysteis]MBG9376846.1 carboxypeptidase regulatory-like domain-containing protein [Panacibacter microcysteis]